MYGGGCGTHLSEVAVAAVTLGLGVGDDDLDAGQQFAGLHQAEAVRRAPLHQRHPVVPQRPQVHVHGAGVW